MDKCKQELEPNYKLLAVFPIEVWHSIFLCLDDFKDYLQISSSSTLFKSLLQSMRTTLLFGNVFKILFNYKHGTERQPKVKEHMPLRRVCASWRKGVDSVLHNLNSPFLTGFCPTFGMKNGFNKFWRHFQNENNFINPFPQRSVHLYIPFSLLQLPLYCTQLLEMLRKFGHKIWYCNMEMFFENPEVRKYFYDQFVHILQNIPNLRQLRFRDHTDFTRFPDEYKSCQQFPKLKRLVNLNVFGMPATVTQQLLDRNQQIGQVVGNFWQIYLETLPNLTELSVSMRNMDDWEKFRNVRVVSPLKYLKLNLGFSVVPWNNLLSTVNSHFGESLADLEICAMNHSNFPKTTFDNSKVEKLRSLKVLTMSTKHAMALDFLLPVRQSLEKLNLVIRENNSNNLINQSELVVKFHQFGDQIQHSNIWHKFPNLKCVRVERWPNPQNVYNRQ